MNLYHGPECPVCGGDNTSTDGQEDVWVSGLGDGHSASTQSYSCHDCGTEFDVSEETRVTTTVEITKKGTPKDFPDKDFDCVKCGDTAVSFSPDGPVCKKHEIVEEAKITN